MTDHSTLELHEDDNFIFALDVSGSMQQNDTPGNLSRFDYALEKMKLFCHEAAKFENEGICIFRFGHKVEKFDHISEDKIDSIIGAAQPNEMATRTDLVIWEAYQEHKEDDHEDTFLFLVTDGEPTNKQAVIDTIGKVNGDLKAGTEFKIVFLIVGNASPDLKNFFQSLSSAFDNVDVLELEKVSFMSSISQALGATTAL
jgi:uncharacterized protein YegL